MITRFYVDNYKCLQNFEYKPKQFELVVGANGSGKSTVFEALDKVRRFIEGEDSRELFFLDTRTKWSIKNSEIFEMDFDDILGSFSYTLEIDLSSINYRVEKEVLKRDGATIYESYWERHHQGSLLHSAQSIEKHSNENRVSRIWLGSSEYVDVVLSNPNQTMFGVHSHILGHITAQICFHKLIPALMSSLVKRPELRPANDLSNFASFYIHVLQQKLSNVIEMIPHLKDVIPNFDSFEVKENFEDARRDLFVVCRSKDKGGNTSVRYRFDELSDGQRALIALYTLLFCTLDKDTTLVIDEPENYVALRELQPWLSLLEERLEEHGGQVILISHHPEFINALSHQTTVFERDNGGQVRIKPFDTEAASTLAPAEIMARGWES